MQIQEFKKQVAELDGKTIVVSINNEINARYIIQKAHFIVGNDRGNIFKLENKADNTFINVNLDMVYKIIAYKQNNAFKLYFDEGIEITIEKEVGI